MAAGGGFSEFFMPAYQGIWLVFVLFLGACLGSFATALVYRLPRNIPLGRAGGKYVRSACPACDHELTWRDLVPVFSWLCQRGRCRYCQAPIGFFYPATEILTIVLSGMFYLLYGPTMLSLWLILMTPVIVGLLMIDIRHMIIPDRLNTVLALGALAAVLTANIGYGPGADYVIAMLIKTALVGGAVFFVMALLLALGFSRILKKEALGGGDIKFFGAAGLWLGVDALPLFMMLSGGVGVVFALIWRRITGQERFPFGPALVIAFILLLGTKNTVF